MRGRVVRVYSRSFSFSINLSLSFIDTIIELRVFRLEDYQAEQAVYNNDNFDEVSGL